MLNMSTILKIMVKIGKRRNASYIGVYFMAANNSKYYIYTNNPF